MSQSKGVAMARFPAVSEGFERRRCGRCGIWFECMPSRSQSAACWICLVEEMCHAAKADESKELGKGVSPGGEDPAKESSE